MMKTTRFIAALLFCALASVSHAQNYTTLHWGIDRTATPNEIAVKSGDLTQWFKLFKLTAAGQPTPYFASTFCGASEWITATAGVPACSQPAFSNISGQATLAQLPQMAQGFSGRATVGTGDREDMTPTQATALLDPCVGDAGSGGTKGMVPAPAAGDAAAGKFLKADCTWATAGGGGSSSFGSGSITNGSSYVVSTEPRNRLINGGMSVDQRNAGAAKTLAAYSGTTNYTVDRWAAYESAAGTGLTAQQQAVLSGGIGYALRIQRANGSTNTNTTALIQVLETNDNIFLQGQAVTLSFKARIGANFSPTSAQITASIISGTGTDQSSANFAAGTWTGQTTCGSATPTITTSFATYVVTCTVASGATQLGVKFSWAWVGTAGAADWIDFTDVQLEEGNFAATAINFERIPFGKQLERSKRYFQKTFNYVTAPADGAGYNGTVSVAVTTASALYSGRILYTATMRTTAALTFYNPGASGTAGYWRDLSNSLSSQPTVVNASDSSVFVYTNNGVAWLPAAINVYSIHATMDAEL